MKDGTVRGTPLLLSGQEKNLVSMSRGLTFDGRFTANAIFASDGELPAATQAGDAIFVACHLF